MGFRFRKTIRLMPGVRLNLSRTGVSTSLGTDGATVNVSKRGVRGTVGIPGSGLSYSEMLTRQGAQPSPTSPAQPRSRKGRVKRWLLIILALWLGWTILSAFLGAMV